MTDVVDHLIGTDWRPSADGRRFETRDPHDDSLLALVAEGGPADADRALAAARRAFDDGPWPRMSAEERRALLHRFADLVDRDAEALALLDTRDMGKPIRESRGMDLPRVSRNLRFFADYAAMAASEAYPDGLRLSYVLYPPAGVVVAIAPWNFPAMQASWKVAPALAFGNTVVLKPAEQSPLTAARLGALALEAGMPEGVLNVVQGFGSAGAGADSRPSGRPDHVHRRERDRPRGRRPPLREADAGLVRARRPQRKRRVRRRRPRRAPWRAPSAPSSPTTARSAWPARDCSSSASSTTPSSSASSRPRRARRRRPQGRRDAGRPAGRARPLGEGRRLRRLAVSEGGDLVCGGRRARPALAGGHYYAPTIITQHAQRHARCTGGDLRARPGGHPVRRRGRRRSPSPTTRPTAWPGWSGRTTWTGRTGWPSAGAPAWSGSTASSNATCGCPFGGEKASGHRARGRRPFARVLHRPASRGHQAAPVARRPVRRTAATDVRCRLLGRRRRGPVPRRCRVTAIGGSRGLRRAVTRLLADPRTPRSGWAGRPGPVCAITSSARATSPSTSTCSTAC